MFKRLGNEKNEISTKKQSKTNNKLRDRRGFTLFELIIALALLAIVSVCIVTFTTMASNQLSQVSARTAFLESAREFKSDFRTAFAEFDTLSAENFSTENPDSENPSNVTVTPNQYQVTTDGKEFKLNNKPLIDLNAEDYSEILTISFNINDTGKILKITLTSSTSNTYTFTVTSRTGSTFK